jgi:peroxiredoxin
VGAERLILVIFNSYCTICQAEARALNMFYQMIEDDPVLKGRTKMVGIAAGNTSMEVEEFSKTYEVPFPVVADPNFSVNQAVTSSLRIPMVITAKILKDQTLEVLKTHLGEAKSMDDLLEPPVRSTRLDPETGPRYH